MPPIRHAVLRGVAPAILATGIGCHDSPMQPNAGMPTSSTDGRGVPSPNQTLSGRAADSVMSILESYWAGNGHPEYRDARLAWRKANGIDERIRKLPGSDIAGMANAELVGGTESTKPRPEILSHYESLYFGLNDGGIQLPSGVNAELAFVGDVGDIELSGLTITRKDGSQYYSGGRITSGAGELVDCGDVFHSTCSRRWLEGAMLLTAAPTCDATGNGSVNYYANNASTSPGGSVLGAVSFSSVDGAAAASAAVQATAPACDPPSPPKPKDGGEDIGGDGTGQGGTGSGGGGSDGGAESWPPPPPPPSDPTHPVGWDCSGVVMSQLIGDVEVFLAEAYVCRPIYY